MADEPETQPLRVPSEGGEPQYDYSHHLSRDRRAQGWRLLGSSKEVLNAGPVQYRQGQDLYMQRGHRHRVGLVDPGGRPQGEVQGVPVSGGHQVLDSSGLKASSPELQGAARAALSQHMDLHREGRLNDLPEVRSRTQALEVQDPRVAAPGEDAPGPTRVDNPYAGKSTTFRRVGIIDRPRRIADAKLYDYSHALPEHLRRSGHVLRLYDYHHRLMEEKGTTNPENAPRVFPFGVYQRGKLKAGGVWDGGVYFHDRDSDAATSTSYQRAAGSLGRDADAVHAAVDKAGRQHLNLHLVRGLADVPSVRSRWAAIEVLDRKRRGKQPPAPASEPDPTGQRTQGLDVGPRGLDLRDLQDEGEPDPTRGRMQNLELSEERNLSPVTPRATEIWQTLEKALHAPPEAVRQHPEGMQVPLWLNRYPILRPEHQQDLEGLAGVNELTRRMPRHQAEAEAHQHYVGQQRYRAAAHHLSGMRAAEAAGEHEAARKHATMYGLHLRALGHEPAGSPPKELQQHLQAHDRKPVYRFKPHSGDFFAVNEGVQASSPAPQVIQKSIPDQVREVLAAARLLIKADEEKQKRRKVKPCRCPHYSFPHRPGSCPTKI